MIREWVHFVRRIDIRAHAIFLGDYDMLLTEQRPAVVGNTYLEGTYSEIYPDISQDEAGLRNLFVQFSFPGGIPRHASPECPAGVAVVLDELNIAGIRFCNSYATAQPVASLPGHERRDVRR